MNQKFRKYLAIRFRHACLREVLSRKAGNVHPWACFDDMDYMDFVQSVEAVNSIWLNKLGKSSVGDIVLECVRMTDDRVGRNTNLGILLLIVPLMHVPEKQSLTDGIEEVLNSLDVEQSRLVFEAIRVAKPGGMGHVDDEDVSAQPTQPLREIMKLAADHDLIARQYANGFQEVLQFGPPILLEGKDFENNWETAIIKLHLNFMANFPDSLIQRKCGQEIANESAQRARKVLDADWPKTDESQRLFNELDTWLREDGNKRNPGTSADMVAATLFAALREQKLPLSYTFNGQPPLTDAVLVDSSIEKTP